METVLWNQLLRDKISFCESVFYLWSPGFTCGFVFPRFLFPVSSMVGQVKFHLSFKSHLKLSVSSSVTHKTLNKGKPKSTWNGPLSISTCRDVGELKLLPTLLITDDQKRECSEWFFKKNQIFLWEHRRSVSASLVFTDVVRNIGFLAYLDIISFLSGNLVWTSLLWFWVS